MKIQCKIKQKGESYYGTVFEGMKTVEVELIFGAIDFRKRLAIHANENPTWLLTGDRYEDKFCVRSMNMKNQRVA